MSFFYLTRLDAWIIFTAALCAVSCGLLGCYLVLRRRALMGDAISHAILPGLALAFIVTNSRAAMPMLLGAMAVGLLTAMLTELLHRWGRVPEDAAMGVVFTSLFALGVVMITRVAKNVDLDPGCVLYGTIELVPLDTVKLLGMEVPRATAWLACVLMINMTLIAMFFKELKIVSFDPYLATTMGINSTLVHYTLMAAVAATTVAAFESVGSILVVAMIIVPGATAHLLTDRLAPMLIISAVVGVAASTFGYLFARLDFINTSVAGMIGVVAGLLFALAVLFAPRHGLLSKAIHRLSLSMRVVREDILGMLYRWKELDRPGALSLVDVYTALGGGLLPRMTLRLMQRAALVRRVHTGIELTPTGEGAARRLIRSHRLWESFLAKRLGLPLDHVHEPAMRMEHFVGPDLGRRIADDVRSDVDPQGRAIPDISSHD